MSGVAKDAETAIDDLADRGVDSTGGSFVLHQASPAPMACSRHDF